MISSIFGKTKPINYIVLISFLFLFYWFIHFFTFDNAYSIENIGFSTIILGILIFSILIVDFLVKRNNLTETNSFSILFYVMLIVAFHETLSDINAIFCSLFLLFAKRRIISIRSMKYVKFKIFDATLWIMISSLFYEWAILYILLIFVAIYIYDANDIRNWLVPFVGIFTVFIISYTIFILANNSGYLVEHYKFSLQFSNAFFLDWFSGISLTLYLMFILFVIVFYFFKSRHSGLVKIFTMRLLAISFLIGFIIDLFTNSSHNQPIFITFFPAAVFMTNFIEEIKKPRVKEVVLILSIFIPFLILILNAVIR